MSQLRLLLKLVVAPMRRRPARALLACAAIVASSCAVVWVVSGYDALVSRFDENANKYLGRYDALIVPRAKPGMPLAIDREILASLAADPGVLELNPVLQARVSVTDAAPESLDRTPLGLLVGARPPVYGAPPLDPTLVGTDAAAPPYEVLEGDWFDGAADDAAAVLSRSAAEQVGVAVGDEVLLTSLANQVRLRVVGVVDHAPQEPSLMGPPPSRRGRKPSSTDAAPAPPPSESVAGPGPQLSLPEGFTEAVAINAVYVRTELAERIVGYRDRTSVAQLSLRDGVEIEEFRRVWRERLESQSPPLQIIDFDRVRSGMESTRSLQTQRAQAYAAAGMASVAAVLIIFSTLSMGVSERTREFAMLRAIALTRKQLAGVIVVESALLALLGWVGGLAAGWGLLAWGSRAVPGLFQEGATLGWACVALTGACVLVGAAGAALLPAWRAMRIRPLDALTAPRVEAGGRWITRMAAIGALLLAVAPATVFVLPLPDAWRIWCYGLVSYPCLVLGMVLLTPAAVRWCEALLASPLAVVLRLDPLMVRAQLTGNLWRTVGATLALALGLALYASTQIWGYSMLQPFLPGAWLPDALVAFHPVGLDDDGARELREIEGVEADEVLPLAIEQARFDWRDRPAPERLNYDNAIVVGFDPHEALGGDDPRLRFRFVEGRRRDVAERLAEGDACLVSLDFQMSTGLGVGDRLTFAPPNAPRERVEYEVAGVVALPGWHWITKFSGVRRHSVRTAAMIFAGHASVRDKFHLGRNEFYWLNFEDDAQLNDVEARLQTLAEQDAGRTFHAAGYGEVTAYRPFARVTATETVREAITMLADEVIWGMSKMPLVTLAIMTLAVVSTVAASVRARTWEYGVLRAVGVTRGQLLRLILAETLLIGAVACLLSLAFGVIAGWCGVGMALYNGPFFAGPTHFVMPWRQLAFGCAATLALCLAAGLIPAFKAGRAEPLELLRSGRAAM